MTLIDRSAWYAIQTNPCCEERARASLIRSGFGVYLPMLRTERQHRRSKAWREIEMPLLRGYLFVDVPVNPAGEHWHWSVQPSWFRLRRCDGVKQVMGEMTAEGGEVVPWPIRGREIEALMAAQLNLEFDDTREAMLRRKEIGRNERETAQMMFPAGARVRAVDGPFATFKGSVIGVTGQGEIEALIELMGRLVPVSFPAAHVERVDRIAA